jgi:hypothetical protein
MLVPFVILLSAKGKPRLMPLLPGNAERDHDLRVFAD